MLKNFTTPKSLTEAPKKYCRLVLTDKPTSVHRFVEAADGVTEYRMGAGKPTSMTVRTFSTLGRSFVQAAKSHQVEFLAIDIESVRFKTLESEGGAWLTSTLVENLLLADYELTTYKTKKDKSNK